MDPLALALGASLILILVARRVHLPPIPFYLVAGLMVGESGLKWLNGNANSAYLGHLGLVFLLFYAGLELKPERFLSRGSGLLVSGLLDLNINLALGFFGALALGFSPLDAFVIGSAFFDTSSAVAIATLIENRRLLSPESETIVWLMILEDLIMIFLIFFVSTEMENPVFLFLKIFTVGAVLILVILLLQRSIAALLKREDEVPVLFTIAAVVGAAALAASLGIPEAVPLIALGAGLSRTDPATLQRVATPFRDVFLAVLFFFFGVTVHLSASISIFSVGILGGLAIVSKWISGLAAGKVLHGSYQSGLEIGNYTIARGEFAIVLAAVYGSAAVSGAVTMLVILTSLAGAILCRSRGPRSEPLVRWISTR
jgi:CPA2 family monovalent cation:H+ antiporter-2